LLKSGGQAVGIVAPTADVGFNKGGRLEGRMKNPDGDGF